MCGRDGTGPLKSHRDFLSCTVQCHKKKIPTAKPKPLTQREKWGKASLHFTSQYRGKYPQNSLITRFWTRVLLGGYHPFAKLLPRKIKIKATIWANWFLFFLLKGPTGLCLRMQFLCSDAEGQNQVHGHQRGNHIWQKKGNA